MNTSQLQELFAELWIDMPTANCNNQGLEAPTSKDHPLLFFPGGDYKNNGLCHGWGAYNPNSGFPCPTCDYLNSNANEYNRLCECRTN